MSVSDLKRSIQSKLKDAATVHSVRVVPMENGKEYRIDVTATPKGVSEPKVFRKYIENRRNPQDFADEIAKEIRIVTGADEPELEVIDLSLVPRVPVKSDGRRRRKNR